MVNVVKSIGVKASAPKSKAATYAEQWKAERAAAAAVKVAPSKRKATAAPDAAPAPEPLFGSVDQDIKNLFSKYAVNLPSGTRIVVSFIAAFCISAGVGYIGGVLLEFLVLGALAFSSSVFLSVALYVLGVLAVVYASYKAGGWIAGVVLTRGAERCYENVSSSVRGFFSANNKEVVS